jgi:coiled-coil and C2 domain-containing protein 2A
VLLQAAHNERVAREMRGCLVNGHILALPFSDAYGAAVADAVLNTGIHRTVDPRVKFAMASYVQPLGHAFVCCCWIYVAAIRETS